MKKFLRLAFSFLFTAVIANPSYATLNCLLTGTAANNAQVTLQNLLDNGHLTGGVVGIYSNGQTQFYSFGNISNQDASTPSSTTIYKIASVTKVFTATLLANAVINNKVKLSDTIDAYLPASASLQPSVKNQITYQELATHTASLPHDPGPDTYDVQSFFENFMNEWTPPYPFGTQFAYSDTSFELLAYLLTQINHVSYPDQLKNQISKPLNMTATASIVDKFFPYPLAMGYRSDGAAQPVFNNKGDWNHIAYLTSNANDLMNFIKANLGVIPVPTNLAQAIALTHKPYFTINDTHSMGLGWGITQVNTANNGVMTIYAKNGGIPSYGAFVGFNPQTKTGVVILVSFPQDAVKVTQRITHLGMCMLASANS